MTSQRIEHCELDWLKNSVNATLSTFNALQFVDECYKSLRVFDSIRIGPQFKQNPKQNNNKMNKYNNLIAREPQRIIFQSFIPLLETLYGYFGTTFEFQSRLQRNRFVLKLSPGQIREMNREDLTSFDRGARTTFTRMLLHVCETTNPTNKENIIGMYKTEDAHPQYERGESVSRNGTPLGDFINE